MKIKIELDSKKIRIYLDGNKSDLEKIEDYLKEQKYEHIGNCMKAASKAMQQKATSYNLTKYSIAYDSSKHKENFNIRIESWFRIAKFFDDNRLAKEINLLVANLLTECSSEYVLQETMKVSGLKSHTYVKVFEEYGMSSNNALKLIKNFETLIKIVRKAAGVDGTKTSSVVQVFFQELNKKATHENELVVFGSQTILLGAMSLEASSSHQ